MKRIKIIVITLLTLLLTSGLFAQSLSKSGTTVAQFLKIDIGARAIGMGGAFVAVAEGPTAMYWNPSGIARVDKFSTVFNHSKWLMDISYNYLGAVLPLGNEGVLGVHAIFLSMDDMELTTVDYPDGIENGFFSAGNYAFGVSYGFDLTDRFSIGFNAKYIEEYMKNEEKNNQSSKRSVTI